MDERWTASRHVCGTGVARLRHAGVTGVKVVLRSTTAFAKKNQEG
jgi:hypothetical protein